jgi:hypothetical protein
MASLSTRRAAWPSPISASAAFGTSIRAANPWAEVRSGARLATTNFVNGGANRCRLYITESESGQILVADVAVLGRPMFSHA